MAERGSCEALGRCCLAWFSLFLRHEDTKLLQLLELFSFRVYFWGGQICRNWFSCGPTQPQEGPTDINPNQKHAHIVFSQHRKIPCFYKPDVKESIIYREFLSTNCEIVLNGIWKPQQAQYTLNKCRASHAWCMVLLELIPFEEQSDRCLHSWRVRVCNVALVMSVNTVTLRFMLCPFRRRKVSLKGTLHL